MAKKKRKKRPGGPPPADQQRSQSARAERKEQARLERERRIKAIRRRRLLKRLAIIVVIVGGIGTVVFVMVNNAREASERAEQADAIAATVGCQALEQPPDEGAGHVQAPPTYQNAPASSGSHSGSPLPPSPSVYDQPFVPTIEFQAVHNLEHGYVLMYYLGEGENALPEGAVDELAGLAEAEPEVIMAPYPSFPGGENLVMVSWGNERRCTVTDADPADVRVVAQAFIDEQRNGPDAPEPQIP